MQQITSAADAENKFIFCNLSGFALPKLRRGQNRTEQELHLVK